jgi:YVTN family beta-propeller protein
LRRWALAAVLVAGSAGILAVFVVSRPGPRRDSSASTLYSSKPLRPVRRAPLRLVEHAVGLLAAPVQDASPVALGGGRVMLLGGLTASDTSTDEVVIAGASGSRVVARLPIGLHDTAAVRIGNDAYLFGGGTASNTQSDTIIRVPTSGGSATAVGRLPAPSSDQAGARIGDTAYIVGGYTGTQWLDSIVAWRPGSPARVVAHLPTPIRYAAVAAVGGKLVIAGGSLPAGTASDNVYTYTPGSGRVVRAGRLPQPTTHAAAAVFDGQVFVIGGRGASLDSQTSRVVLFDPVTGKVRAAGSLSSPRSDLAAVTDGGWILLAGGRGITATTSGISSLTPGRAHTVTSAQAASSVTNVYAFDGAGMLTGAARRARSLVYVPNSESGTVDVIDQRTYRTVEHFDVGVLPQHVVPGYDLKTLYVTNDIGNSLTTINPRTGKPGRTIPVDDPYNMYFTPNGRYAIVVAERLHRLDFRNPHTFALTHSLSIPCAGVDHLDFSADGRFLIASCEFSGQLVKVDTRRQRVVGVLNLPDGPGGQPQDVRISPNGGDFYVADLAAGGVWKIDGRHLRVLGFIRTGAGAHGLYPSRNGKDLYVSNRGAGSVSVISFRTQKVIATWHIPGGGSPDMGGVSADGRVLWLSGRYNSDVYAISTQTGHLLARIAVGAGPHGLCVWPQPGRYSLGHTDNMR